MQDGWSARLLQETSVPFVAPLGLNSLVCHYVYLWLGSFFQVLEERFLAHLGRLEVLSVSFLLSGAACECLSSSSSARGRWGGSLTLPRTPQGMKHHTPRAVTSWTTCTLELPSHPCLISQWTFCPEFLVRSASRRQWSSLTSCSMDYPWSHDRGPRLPTNLRLSLPQGVCLPKFLTHRNQGPLLSLWQNLSKQE